MSIATELTRIQGDKATIRSKLVELGMATGTDNLDTLAAAIAALENKGAVNVTVKEGETYTIPKGYHNGTGTVAGVAGGGNYTLQQKEVTPTKLQQSIVSDEGFYGLSGVTVKAIPDNYQDISVVTATKEDVLAGKAIVTSDGQTAVGTMVNNGAVSATLDASNTEKEIPEGYHDGDGSVKVVLETKEVTPTKEQQTVNATTGKLISSVTVEAIPDQYVDTSDADAEAANILAGKSAYVGTTKVEGTMPDNADVSAELDGMATTTVEIPAGYTSGGTITLTDSIENALKEI